LTGPPFLEGLELLSVCGHLDSMKAVRETVVKPTQRRVWSYFCRLLNENKKGELSSKRVHEVRLRVACIRFDTEIDFVLARERIE